MTCTTPHSTYRPAPVFQSRSVDILSTRQTVYFHFGNRAKLLIEVARHVDETVEPLPDLAAPVWNAATGVEAVGRFVELVADYYPRIYDIMREAYGTRTTDPDMDAAWRDRLESRKAACRGLIEWLQRDGDLTGRLELDDAVDLLTTLTAFGTWEDLTLYQDWGRERYVRLLQHVIGRSLLDGGAEL